MTKMPFEVDASVWRAVVGSSVEIPPPLNSNVYYFPEGHLERIRSPSATVFNYNFTLSRPFIPCQLLSLRFLSDPSSDKLFVKMILRPRPCDDNNNNNNNHGKNKIENDVVSFSKSLTSSDANNGGGLSIPKFCAQMIFPQLEPIAGPGDTPGQDLTVTDAISNHAWAFRHIYRGTPRRHILSTGWSQFLKSKRLSTGDTVVFVKKKSTEELFVGVRRRALQRIDQGRKEGGNREALEAVRRAEAGMDFEVVYYPEFGWPDFVVRTEKVEDALKMRWTEGMQVRMWVDGDDFSRLSWFHGVVAASTSLAVLRSPWRMLQVNWDEPEVLPRRVCPWQVQRIPLIEPQFLPPSKKLKAHMNAAAGLTLLPESIHRHDPNTSLACNISSPTLYFSGGIQGVRQDDDDQQPGSSAVVSTILSIGSSWSESEDDQQPGPSAAVSTILRIGSSWSDSEDVHACRTDDRLGSQHRHIGSSGCSTTFRLFGKMIHMPEPVVGTTRCASFASSGVNCIVHRD